MRDRLHENSPEAATGDEAPKPRHGRFEPCEVCGQLYDRIDPMLAAYHSVAQHKPLADSTL